MTEAMNEFKFSHRLWIFCLQNMFLAEKNKWIFFFYESTSCRLRSLIKKFGQHTIGKAQELNVRPAQLRPE